MPNEISTQRTLRLPRPVELPPSLVAMLQQRPEPEPPEPERPAPGFEHVPADPATVAWNQAREAQWEADHPPPVKFTHAPADAETLAHNQRLEAAWHDELARVEEVLRGLCPAAFCDPPRPLRIGVFIDLCELLRGEFDGSIIGSFLHAWTRRPAYLDAIARGGPRFDLDGHPVGMVTAGERVGRGGKP